jgi:hypothetical protein
MEYLEKRNMQEFNWDEMNRPKESNSIPGDNASLTCLWSAKRSLPFRREGKNNIQEKERNGKTVFVGFQKG